MTTQNPPVQEMLDDLAGNWRWARNEHAMRVFRAISPELWEDSGYSPPKLIRLAEANGRLTELESDSTFKAVLKEAYYDLLAYLAAPTAWEREHPDDPLTVAYFSSEYGAILTEPTQFSGGLGILAGDHIQCASDVLPLVGIGLWYREGYFQQELRWNRQVERYPSPDPADYGLELCPQVLQGTIGGEPVTVRIWLARVGRSRLYLLDTNVPENSPSVRDITDRLYGGDIEHRIRQEIILGVFGVKALRALGEPVTVYHMNEGHAGFSGLERVRELVTQSGLSFAEAVAEVRTNTKFTTHTPVDAGIDRFPHYLVEKYFTKLAGDCHVPVDEIMALGHTPSDSREADLNMAYFGLALSRQANGVSQLHGAVSRELFHPAFPDVSVDEVPIGSITNGVDPLKWTPPAVAALLTRHIGPDWATAPAKRWAASRDIPAPEIWQLREIIRGQLMAAVRRRMKEQMAAVGSNEADWYGTVLKAKLLTIGFGRRAAPYKRLAMLLTDEERLFRLLRDPECPVQFVFAGKAHPQDEPGKRLIEQIGDFATRWGVRDRFVFVPDYNIGLAQAILGADVWLNTPRRPLEASGTSGEKAVYSLGLNCSIKDGWWNEAGIHGVNGWVIEEGPDDLATAHNLYAMLENEVVPMFYDRNEYGIPEGWVNLIRGSLETLGGFVSAHRMVKDYETHLYVPAQSAPLTAIG